MKITIGEFESLKQYRIRKNLKQNDIAKLLDVSSRQFRRYENKECALPMKEGIAYSKALGLSIKKFAKYYYKKEEIK